MIEFDHSIYVFHINGDNLIFVMYVDDLFITGNNIDQFI